MLKGSRLTDALVGLLMMGALVWTIFQLVPLSWAIGLSVLLAYESFTIINKSPSDTISESIWRLSKRPLVPLLIGVTVGVFFRTSLLDVGVGMLVGHFVWQSQGIYEAPKNTHSNL